MLDEKALGTFFGLVTNDVGQLKWLSPIELFREGRDFLTAHPQLHEELETMVFNIVDTTGLSRDTVRAVLNVALPELAKLGPVAAKLVDQHRSADTTGMGLAQPLVPGNGEE